MRRRKRGAGKGGGHLSTSNPKPHPLSMCTLGCHQQEQKQPGKRAIEWLKDTVKENPQAGPLGQPTTAAEKEIKKEMTKNNQRKQLWWHTSVIPALGR